MQHDDVVGALFLAVLVLFSVAMGALVVRRMRARRREQFGEPEVDEAPRAVPPVPVAPPTAKPREPAPLPPTVAPEPEPQSEPELESALVPPPSAAAPAPKAAPVVRAPVTDAVLTAGMAKTQASFFGRIHQLFSRSPEVDAKVLDELEEVLLTADVGVGLATRFLDDLRKKLKNRELGSADAVTSALREQLQQALHGAPQNDVDPLVTPAGGKRPRIILFVGVNGVGKTTTIGKIASQLQNRGTKVLLAAGDTFRAAAAEQLGIWGERTGARVVRGEEGSDPASVIFNAIDAAKQGNYDVVLADTAGRLHTKTELMDEIKKVQRAASKARPEAPDETWLVVDATTGQNALQQAREFNQALGLTGVILTKLDGTAKGGVVVAIVDALKIPVRFVGVGEKAEDLRAFHPEAFVAALVG